jgi:hypothetical protein
MSMSLLENNYTQWLQGLFFTFLLGTYFTILQAGIRRSVNHNCRLKLLIHVLRTHRIPRTTRNRNRWNHTTGFIHEEGVPIIHWLGGCVGPRAGLDAAEEGKTLSAARNRISIPRQLSP